MSTWMVKIGRRGEHEELALEKNLTIVGWSSIPDLTKVSSRDEIVTILNEVEPHLSPSTIQTYASELWAFRGRINKGDIILSPMQTRSAVAVGKITGDYSYRADLPDGARHTRPVKWIKEISRTALSKRIFSSFNSALTIACLDRRNVEEEVQAILEDKPVPESDGSEMYVDEPTSPIDLEQEAKDRINEQIGKEFHGHRLAALVEAILKAQGYKTNFSSPGPDGGVDIIAGQGPLGFDAPRLCVQVKSGNTPVDVTVLRNLKGILKDFGADHGLLVSWGGFTVPVIKEARNKYFEIRLWDAGDLLSALFETYEKLPEDIQAEIPLKRIWTLVPEE